MPSLRQLNNNTSTSSSSQISTEHRRSITGGLGGGGDHQERKSSVTDKEVSKWFQAVNNSSLDQPTENNQTPATTTTKTRATAVIRTTSSENPKQPNQPKIRLPNILGQSSSSTPTSSKPPIVAPQTVDPPYSHLEASASLESSNSESNNNNRNKQFDPNSRQKQGCTSSTTKETAATRISSARQRLRASKNISNVTNSSSRDDDIMIDGEEDEAAMAEDEDRPSLLPHHPHSPPHRPRSSVDSRMMSMGGGNLLTVPTAATIIPPIASSVTELTSIADDTPTVTTTEKNGKAGQGRSHTPTASMSSLLSRHHYPKLHSSQHHHQSTFDQSNGPGVFLNDGQRRVDFILVYQTGHSMSLERQRRYFERNLQQEGLVLELDPLDGNEEVGRLCFVKVHAPWSTLCRSAEMLQMKMPLRNAELPEDSMIRGTQVVSRGGGGLCEIIFDTLCQSWFKFNDTEDLLIGRQSHGVTAQFTRARIEQFLITDTETFFTPTQRIRIVYDIMQRAKCDPDNTKKRGLQWLLKNNVYSAAYPPHDGGTETRHLHTNEPEKWSQRQILKHTWANFNRVFKPQPLNLVRTYFGEKVGFYFAWLGFYTQMLVFPSIVGVICFLYGVFSLPSNPMIIELCSLDRIDKVPANLTMCPVCVLPYCHPWTLHDACEGASWNYRFDHESHVFMALFTLVWATLFMELWKRKEAELACEWDAYDAEQEEEGMRPEYEARTQIIRVSPVTNEEEPYIPACKRILWALQSLSGLFMLIMCVVAALVALITIRILLYGMLGDLGGTWKKYQFEFASLIIHVLTFVIVMTLGWVYEKAAHRLTELECPRTQADYLSSYIWKVFIFEILNNFAPVLYAALIRGRSGLPQHQTLLLEMCDPGGCLNEVVQAIAILLLARLLISNAAELGVPFLKSLLKTMRLGAAVNPEHDDEPTVLRNLPRWQKDYTLNETNLDGVYAEYLEMMVQFGYVTLFVSAFPLAPLICLLNNIAEIRIDATNFVTSFRRPLPSRVSGIRIWRRCLNIMIKLSVLTNGAFLAFTSELIPKIVYKYWYSDDGSTHGYIRWTLAKVNTTNWEEYARFAPPNSTECYYRDFRQSADAEYGPTLVWWQVMVARLSFFIVFVIAFYFIQWLCDFLVPDVPQHVKLRVDRANFVAKQALYGQEMRGGARQDTGGGGGGANSSSATPSAKSHHHHLRNGAKGMPWSTSTSSSAGLADYIPKSRPSSPRLVQVANGELLKKRDSSSLLTNGVLMNVNGYVAGALNSRKLATDGSAITNNHHHPPQQQQQQQHNYKRNFPKSSNVHQQQQHSDSSAPNTETTYV